MKVPDFLARQFYVAGSLRNSPDGFRLEAQNPMGNGVLVGVGRMLLDGREIAAEAVTAQRAGDEEIMRATEVSSMRPIRVAVGDRVVLHVAGEPLAAGAHELEVELVEVNLGRLRFAIRDELSD